MADNSFLLGLFGGSSAGFGFTPFSPVVRKPQPTPPWTQDVEPQKASAQVRSALAGRRIINEATTRLDVQGGSADYRPLFALYEGLTTLAAMTDRAAARGVSASEQALLAKRFEAGLAEISTYLGNAPFEDLRLVQGISASTAKSTAAVARDSNRLVTAAVHQGALTSPVDAFAGEVRFGVTVTTSTGTKTVDIDLSEMGPTSRTFDAVTGHINDKLQAAGIETRFSRERVPQEPRVIKTGDKTITLPAGPEQWALAVIGTPGETVALSAPVTADAVYVVQGAGDEGGHQLLKFQTDIGGTPPPAEARIGETRWVDGRASQTKLPDGIDTVRASATAPDGSLWIVSDVDSGPANQPIKGERDVVLSKYDTAGRLVMTRSLGAASSASGYAIAVDASGNVAVAGSVTGGLIEGKVGDSATLSDSFVTVFDADGEEKWTQRRGARLADEATSVGFGADGTVYVAGRAQSAIPGTAAVGGWDGYVQSFTASSAYTGGPMTARATSGTQFGTTGSDSVQAMVVDGTSLYTAGVENGRAVVRSFTLDAAGVPVLSGTRDLGEASGDISGIAVSNGQVMLTGTTRNAALSAGTVNRAHSGGTDAFVAVLSSDLAAASTDRLTYYGQAGDDTAADVKIHDGKVWITGVNNRPEGAKDTDPTEAYLARLDPLSGAVEWSRSWTGDASQAAPLTLAVGAGGASVLDRLGLPQGTIDKSDSKRLIDATSLRVGDRFYVSPPDGGRSMAVTIAANDTLQTLATKIERASLNKLKVTVASEGIGTANGLQRLSIMARTAGVGAVLTTGETGRDALAGLGLSSGYVGSAGDSKTVKTFGLNLANTLSLDGTDAIKATGERLEAVLKVIRDAYRSLSPTANTPAITGEVPPYLSAQLANYQAALARLGG